MSSCEKASQWTTALAILEFVGKISVRRSIVSYNTALDLEKWKVTTAILWMFLENGGTSAHPISSTIFIHHFHPPCLAFFCFSYILSLGKPILGLLPHHKVMSACVSTENWQLAMDLYSEAMQSTMRSVVVLDECFAWEGWQPKQLEIRKTLAILSMDAWLRQQPSSDQGW